LLGYPDAALADVDDALKEAREIGQAAALIFALFEAAFTNNFCGNYAASSAQADELVALADEKAAFYWKASGMFSQGLMLALKGKYEDAVQVITARINARRAIGGTSWTPLFLSYLASSHAALGHFDDSWRCLHEALVGVEATQERWFEAEIRRIAREIAMMAPEPDAAKAQAYLEHALAIARQQQAKSWELRSAMSMSRLWCDQGKRQQAHDLLAPVYGWFTEGFDTLDLKEAKALLEQLKA